MKFESHSSGVFTFGGTAIFIVIGILLLGWMFRVTAEGGEELVLTAKPILFGKEGVLSEPVSAGSEWVSWTTSSTRYVITPKRFDEPFNDLVSSDKIPVDFNAYLTIQIKKGLTPVLHENFGANWYKNNVQDVFRTEVRNFAKKLSGSDLISDADSLLDGQQQIHSNMQNYIDSVNLPLLVNRVVIGKAQPNKALQDEIDRTAAQSQRVKTEQERKKAEDARLNAEKAKADADRGYIVQSQMNIDQYLMLRSLEIEREKIELVKNNPNAKVLLMSGNGGVMPTYDVKN
ncbi:hypothetical protein LP316_14970 [Thalassotalea sp. LPB0316]|uniref:SPFH domain-containing protein n=1 Tax=Thalassotalea sp. LPB0316 TaxID=2769490 RepID=UPI001866D109|nr:SPFH domain-containing protein [Thalassotalea sp. LPB0316]QOL25576.1 hypothetical protein LP316_14970 [Thalassotalea sp. LPB0316]